MNTSQSFTISVWAIAVAVLLLTTPVQAAEDNQAKQRERELIDVLQSDSPKAEKAITCKHLAVHGTGDAVPALAPLLTDPQLASWARIALEVIPDPAADAALRDAAKDVSGRLLIGVINSIGVRHDPAAVDLLSKLLADTDADVASAAAIALGRIGNPPATEVLQSSLAVADPAVRSAVAAGCILCAERLLDDGQANESARIYDQVRQADVPKQRVLEATRGAILARQADGIPLLVEQLKSDDRDLYHIGLTTARELAADGVTEALVTLLGETTPDRQASLLLVLSDRGDSEALPAVLQTAWAGPVDVRSAAIRVLEHLGNVSCVPTLLEIAQESDEEISSVAKTALQNLPGEDVDADLAARLSEAEGKTRQLVIELVGKRRIDAVPALLKAANDADVQIRNAALTALGSTVGLQNLSVLITRVVAPRDADDKAAAEQALRAACVRMPDREACAAQLDAAMAQAPLTAKGTILEILGTMGGNQALRTLGAAAKNGEPELQDTASRLLGEWMSVDAADALLELAGTPDAPYKTRALRGYIRLARQFSMPEDQRAEMCRAALRTAERDAERKLVLQVLERYPSIETLKIAVEVAKDAALKNDAAASSLVIAQKIGGQSAEVQELLAEVGHDPVELEIVKAEYGAGDQLKDVTETLRKHAGSLPLIALPSGSYNSSFGDPAPGSPKKLKVEYRINGKSGEVSLAEDAIVILPMPR